MHKSRVVEKLKQKKPAFAIKIAFQDTAIYEMAGHFDYDAVWICNEHIGIDPSMMKSIITGCRSSGIDAMVRTKPANYIDLMQPLEMGATGYMVPMIKNVDEVREIVSMAKFPPLGNRGLDGVNADADFGLVELKDYLKHANDDTFLMIQIETLEAIEHIEAIAEVDGVDIIFVGAADLSLAMGYPGDVDHPDVLKVCERVQKACEKNGKVAGASRKGRDKIKQFLDMGYGFICCGSDYGFVRQGLTNTIEELREFMD